MIKENIVYTALLLCTTLKILFNKLYGSLYSYDLYVGILIPFVLMPIKHLWFCSTYKRRINITLILVFSEINIHMDFELEFFLLILVLIFENKDQIFKDKDYYLIIFLFKFILELSRFNREYFLQKSLLLFKLSVLLYYLNFEENMLVKEYSLFIEASKVNGIFEENNNNIGSSSGNYIPNNNRLQSNSTFNRNILNFSFNSMHKTVSFQWIPEERRQPQSSSILRFKESSKEHVFDLFIENNSRPMSKRVSTALLISKSSNININNSTNNINNNNFNNNSINSSETINTFFNTNSNIKENNNFRFTSFKHIPWNNQIFEIPQRENMSFGDCNSNYLENLIQVSKRRNSLIPMVCQCTMGFEYITSKAKPKLELNLQEPHLALISSEMEQLNILKSCLNSIKIGLLIFNTKLRIIIYGNDHMKKILRTQNLCNFNIQKFSKFRKTTRDETESLYHLICQNKTIDSHGKYFLDGSFAQNDAIRNNVAYYISVKSFKREQVSLEEELLMFNKINSSSLDFQQPNSKTKTKTNLFCSSTPKKANPAANAGLNITEKINLISCNIANNNPNYLHPNSNDSKCFINNNPSNLSVIEENSSFFNEILKFKTHSVIANGDHLKIVLIEEASSEISIMKQQLENVLKSKFIITISHELNNPLSCLISSLETMVNYNDVNKQESKNTGSLKPTIGPVFSTIEFNKITFYTQYIEFFIMMLSLNLKMKFNEKIHKDISQFKLGEVLELTILGFKKLLKQLKISLKFPDSEKINEIIVEEDYIAFKFIIKAILVFIRNVSPKKSLFKIKCDRIKENKNSLESNKQSSSNKTDSEGNEKRSKSTRTFNSLENIKSDSESLKHNNYSILFENIYCYDAGFTSSWNSGFEDRLNISTSVATGELVYDFLINFTKLHKMDFEVVKHDNQLKSIELGFKVDTNKNNNIIQKKHSHNKTNNKLAFKDNTSNLTRDIIKCVSPNSKAKKSFDLDQKQGKLEFDIVVQTASPYREKNSNNLINNQLVKYKENNIKNKNNNCGKGFFKLENHHEDDDLLANNSTDEIKINDNIYYFNQKSLSNNKILQSIKTNNESFKTNSKGARSSKSLNKLIETTNSFGSVKESNIENDKSNLNSTKSRFLNISNRRNLGNSESFKAIESGKFTIIPKSHSKFAKAKVGEKLLNHNANTEKKASSTNHEVCSSQKLKFKRKNDASSMQRFQPAVYPCQNRLALNSKAPQLQEDGYFHNEYLGNTEFTFNIEKANKNFLFDNKNKIKENKETCTSAIVKVNPVKSNLNLSNIKNAGVSKEKKVIIITDRKNTEKSNEKITNSTKKTIQLNKEDSIRNSQRSNISPKSILNSYESSSQINEINELERESKNLNINRHSLITENFLLNQHKYTISEVPEFKLNSNPVDFNNIKIKTSPSCLQLNNFNNIYNKYYNINENLANDYSDCKKDKEEYYKDPSYSNTKKSSKTFNVILPRNITFQADEDCLESQISTLRLEQMGNSHEFFIQKPKSTGREKPKLPKEFSILSNNYIKNNYENNKISKNNNFLLQKKSNLVDILKYNMLNLNRKKNEEGITENLLRKHKETKNSTIKINTNNLVDLSKNTFSRYLKNQERNNSKNKTPKNNNTSKQSRTQDNFISNKSLVNLKNIGQKTFKNEDSYFIKEYFIKSSSHKINDKTGNHFKRNSFLVANHHLKHLEHKVFIGKNIFNFDNSPEFANPLFCKSDNERVSSYINKIKTDITPLEFKPDLTPSQLSLSQNNFSSYILNRPSKIKQLENIFIESSDSYTIKSPKKDAKNKDKESLNYNKEEKNNTFRKNRLFNSNDSKNKNRKNRKSFMLTLPSPYYKDFAGGSLNYKKENEIIVKNNRNSEIVQHYPQIRQLNNIKNNIALMTNSKESSPTFQSPFGNPLKKDEKLNKALFCIESPSKKKGLKHRDSEASRLNTHVCSNSDILVVDDEEYNRKTIVNLLKISNIAADEASDGSECISKVLKKENCGFGCKHYKLIFMDINMPEMDGITASKELSTKFGNPNYLSIIIVSAHDSDEVREMVRNIPLVTTFISKPINKKKMTEVIEKYYKMSLS